MSEFEVKALIPWADPELSGDEGKTDFESWLDDQLDYAELSPAFQRWARLHLARFRNIDGSWVEIDDPVQVLTGQEELVRFMPGDRFTGIEDRAWLIQRLVLSPQYGRLRSSVYGNEHLPRLTCFLDDEEIDVMDEVDDFPLGPNANFWGKELVAVGSDSPTDMTLVAATLYEASPWLVSVWTEVRTDFLPIPTNEMGEESEYRMVHEIWAWIAEMIDEWVSIGAEHELSIQCTFLTEDLDHDFDEMLQHIARAAQGGRGTISFNGSVLYQPEASA